MTVQRDPEWDAMFDLQYDLCQQLDRVIDEALNRHPAAWRSTAMLYVLEHLAERARFTAELPPLPAVPTEGTCRVCGCTDDQACIRFDPLATANLCSECAP